MKKKCLNLGSGFQKKQSNEEEEWVNIDKDRSTFPEIVRDLNNGLPFDDNSIDIISSSHTLEHIKNIRFLMEESYRVLKNGGRFIYEVPHALSGNGGFRHHEHIHFFVEGWEKFYCEWALTNDYNCNFRLIKQEKIKQDDDTCILKGELIKEEAKVPKDQNLGLIRFKKAFDFLDFNIPFFSFLINGNVLSIHNCNKERLTKMKEIIDNYWRENGI